MKTKNERKKFADLASGELEQNERSKNSDQFDQLNMVDQTKSTYLLPSIAHTHTTHKIECSTQFPLKNVHARHTQNGINMQFFV